MANIVGRASIAWPEFTWDKPVRRAIFNLLPSMRGKNSDIETQRL